MELSKNVTMTTKSFLVPSRNRYERNDLPRLSTTGDSLALA